MNLKLFSSQPGFAVTAIFMPKGCCGETIKANLEKNHGIVVAGGHGILKGRIIRIGHLGPLTRSQHLKGLKAFGWELRKANPKLFTREKLDQALKRTERELEKSPVGV